MINVSLFFGNEKVGVATYCDENEASDGLEAFSFFRVGKEGQYDDQNIGIILLSIGWKYGPEFWSKEWIINFIINKDEDEKFAKWLVSRLAYFVPASVTTNEQRRLYPDQDAVKTWREIFGGEAISTFEKIKEDCAREAMLGLCCYIVARNKAIAKANKNTIN